MAAKGMTEHDHPRYRFDKRLLEHAKSKTQLHANVSPSKSKWTGAWIAGFCFLYAVGEDNARVELKVDNGNEDDNDARFQHLLSKKEQIEEAFGGSLEWDPKQGRQRCLIGKDYNAGGYGDEDNWDALCEQLSDGMAQLEKAFKPHIRSLRVVTGRVAGGVGGGADERKLQPGAVLPQEGAGRAEEGGRGRSVRPGLLRAPRQGAAEARSGKPAVHDEWKAVSRPHEPHEPTTPGIYALYQNGVLKYIGQSRDCAYRIHKHCTHGRDWLERKSAWEIGEPITARVQPLPDLTGGNSSDDARLRQQIEQYWLYYLRPPCNDRIPENCPPPL